MCSFAAILSPSGFGSGGQVPRRPLRMPCPPAFPFVLLLGVLAWLLHRWARRIRPKAAEACPRNTREVIPVHPLARDSEHELRELVIPEVVTDCVPAEAPRAYEHKFGAPRSELYKMDYSPVDEDVPSLIHAAVSDELQRPLVEQRLEQLRLFCFDLPASGWVQPHDPRVLLRFLLARQCNVHRAREMLQDVLSWRRQHDVAHALPQWEKVKHERFDSYWKASGGIFKEAAIVDFN
eukprot:s540_g15.t1